MKNTLRNTLVALIAFSSSAYAAANGSAGEGSLLLSLFIGFFALIVVFQLVPATLMFIGMVKGLTSKNNKEVKSSN
ncbi:MAG: hypothetical protein QM483_02060 [Desulfuromusa sp.]